jgi:hypothetical protein
MRIWIRDQLSQAVRNKWFWLGLILILPIIFISDLIISFLFILGHFYSPVWNPYLLAIGIISAIFGAVGAKKKIWESKTLRDLGKLLFFIALIWVIRDYGFWQMLLFMSGILITTRILKWLIPKKSKVVLTS